METSTVTKTPKLGKIDLEMLEYIVANLGDHAPQYPMTNHDGAMAELFDLMESLDFCYGGYNTQILLLGYFANHKAAFNSISEELRFHLFGTTSLDMDRAKDRSHFCPVCGKFRFPHGWAHERCEVCGWTDDKWQTDHPDEDCHANIMSLNEARAAYARGEEIQ